MPAGGLLTASIAAPVVGGIIGNMAASDDRDAAMAAAQKALEYLNSIGTPPDLSKALVLKQFQSAGTLTPEMEQAINLGTSQQSQIAEDPKLRDAQMSALQLLGQRSKSGLTAQDRSNINQVRSETQRDTEAKRQQILQNMQMRGQAGSGQELAAQLLASQAGADSQAKASDDIMAQAQQAALQAAGQYGNMAGSVRSQDFNNASAKAQAADEFSRFNVQNQQNVANTNVGAQNTAQASNLQNAQNISDKNTGQYNAEQQRQAEAQRQYWQDQLALAQAKGNASNGQANAYNNAANQTANMWSGMGNAVGQGAGAFASYNAANKKVTPTTPGTATTKYGQNPT